MVVIPEKLRGVTARNIYIRNRQNGTRRTVAEVTTVNGYVIQRRQVDRPLCAERSIGNDSPVAILRAGRQRAPHYAIDRARGR